MTTPVTSLPDKERLEAAAVWHARISDSREESAWVAFTAWLEADPLNRVAFDVVDEIASEVAEAVPSLPEADDLGEEDNLPATPRAPWMTWRTWAPAAVVATVVLGVVLKPTLVTPPVTQALATAVGERKDVQLSDGSTVHLNTDTAVSVSFSNGERRARVEKGEALFEVAADAGRPFDVMVGDKRVHVVGTAFDILRRDGQVTVAVKHGVVQVQSDTGNDKQAAVKLLAGDQFVGREGSAEYKVASVDPSTVAPWEQGRLFFNDAPLSQVAADLSRYVKRPVVVQDENVGSMRFSGVLKIDDELSMARRLAAFLPIAVQEREDKVVLERGSSK